MTSPAPALVGVGVWSRELRYNSDRTAVLRAVENLESLGFSAVWIPDSGGDPIGIVDSFLDVTDRLVAATGILNIWMHEPADVADGYRATTDRFGSRFVLGIGNSHASLVDGRVPGGYRRPVERTVRFLDGLAAAGLATDDAVVLAALGPRMQDLARERCAGTHPYLITADYVARMRARTGRDSFLAPELGVVVDNDPSRARERARAHLSGYLAMPNYLNNFRRLGFVDSDFAGGGSDRLVDALVAWGSVESIAARIGEYFAAGANHVCLQVVGGPDEQLPDPEWRELAAVATAFAAAGRAEAVQPDSPAKNPTA